MLKNNLGICNVGDEGVLIDNAGAKRSMYVSKIEPRGGRRDVTVGVYYGIEQGYKYQTWSVPI